MQGKETERDGERTTVQGAGSRDARSERRWMEERDGNNREQVVWVSRPCLLAGQSCTAPTESVGINGSFLSVWAMSCMCVLSMAEAEWVAEGMFVRV